MIGLIGRLGKILAPILIGLLGFAACTASTAQPPPAKVPMFRGNLQRTGVYEESGRPLLSGELWEYQAEYAIDSPPVVGEGLAFVHVMNYGLEAIDIKTGIRQYTLNTYQTTPLVAEAVLYYGG